MLLGLASSGLISPKLGVVLLIVYLITSINSYLATLSMGIFKISYAGFSPTECRVLLIAMNIILIFVREVSIGVYRVKILDLGAVVASVILTFLTLRSAVLCLSQLNRVERAAWQKPES
jgi:hypothetical protein